MAGPRSNNRKGMSLVEMLVAISILVIGMAGFSMLFVRSWKTNSFIIEEGIASSQASRAVMSISSKIRETRQSDTGEFVIKLAEASQLVVYNNEDSDNSVERVHYYYDETNQILKKGVAKASGSPLAYPSDFSSDTVTDMVKFVTNSGADQPIFRYYDNNNAQLVSPVLTDIKMIELNLWINIKPLSAPDNINFSTKVELRNLDESI